MATKRTTENENSVDPRKSTILKVVVDSYISDPTPVASKTVTERSGLDVSPATIRNDMHALEDAGYLTQTHTSSGRIPTDQGYRFFVDNFVPHETHSSRDKTNVNLNHELERALDSGPDYLLEKAVILLSSLTQHTAVIMKDSSKDASVADVHMSRLDDGRIVVALFLDDSTIERAVIESNPDFGDVALTQWTENLRRNVAGQSLRDLLRVPPTELDDGIRSILDAFRRETSSTSVDAAVHVAGVANIAKSSGDSVNDHGEISAQLLALVEQHMVLVDLIRNSVDETIAARIGSENVAHELSRHSMVLAPFVTDGGEQGAVGIIGPTRMDYSKVFAYLNSVSSTIPKFLD